MVATASKLFTDICDIPVLSPLKPLGTAAFFPTIPTSEQSLDPQIYKELLGHVVEVETKAFVRAVLYKNSQTMEEDERLAAQYLELFRTSPPHEGRAGGDPTDSSPQQPTIPPPTTSHPTESTPNGRPSTPGVPPHQMPLLQKCYASESDMYSEHAECFNSVSCFFRANKKDVDEAWLPAQPPGHDASQDAGPPLNRVFQDTHNLARSFSRYKYGQAGLKPDLCFLIESGGAPKESEGEPKESKPKPKQPKPKLEEPKPKLEEPKPKPEEPKPKSEESKPKPKVTAHWKDVLVPIELKKPQNMDASDLVQMAQYARSIMAEQYDRTFVITVLITGHICRVFHWDVARAQVTLAFNIHENPQLFVQVLGRLATMTPSELGYDTHFSNAGRVRSTERIETHLTIHLSKPRPFLNHAIPSPTPECPHKLVVKLKEMLFESTGGLFSRATRVWRIVPVNDPPPEAQGLWSKKDTYIVKQNWADDKRPNGGIFHTLAKDVAAVPQLVGMQELEFTHSFRTRFEHAGEHLSAADVGDQEDVVDQEVASEADTGNKEPLERVLLRFVFKGQGRPLSEATDSIELLRAVAQWVPDRLGITHRDVSYGNLLLPLLLDEGLLDEEGQASIIDLGLSHLQDPTKIAGLYPAKDLEQKIQTIFGKSQLHHRHITGTLPFVAIELLKEAEDREECLHSLHHDLKSVFWVLLYTCIKHHEGTGTYLNLVYGGMTSPDSHAVFNEKIAIFGRDSPLRNMGGKFSDLEPFLHEFFKLCRRTTKVIEASEIEALVSEELQKLLMNPRGTKRRPESPLEHGPAPAMKKKAPSYD